jgi:adenylate cyclase
MLELHFYVDGEEKVVVLGPGETRFGRSSENEVVLPDYSVSRRHALIQREGDAFVIADQNSTNGVQVNGRQVPRSPVRAGDVMKIGIFEIRLVDRSAGAAAAANAGLGQAELPPGFYGTPTPPLQPPPAEGAWGGANWGGTTPLSPSAQMAAALQPPASPATGTAAAQAGFLPGAPPLPPVQAAGAISVAPPPPNPQVASALANMGSDSAISNATIVRSLRDLSAQFGLETSGLARDSSLIRQNKRKALDAAYSSQVFGFLSRLARMLITTASDDEILSHVMDIAFEAFPVDRGFILLRNEKTGELACDLVRLNNRTEFRPSSEVPISKTMLEAVMRERVALLTYDALSDRRLAGTESVRIHQIRAAMCTPLWSGEKIIGVMQLDTPHHTGTFTEPDVDLLATIANFAAVAIERNRNAREAEYQRELRNRLSRYHSPAVIEEVMQEGASSEGSQLRKTEVTVLFADIVGFTAFSENSPPEEVANLMEGYFTHAVEAIFSLGGTLDKFIGDCVMAFFGAPMRQPDHAYRAVAAAVRIREALEKWNAERAGQGLSLIKTRIAINTGPVVVGDIGSNRRVDYTVLGNTVNVAARLEESVCTPGDIVVGDETFRQLAGRLPTEKLGEFALKGLSQKVIAHKVM